MVTPIITLEAVDSPGFPWSDKDPDKLAVNDGSSIDEMVGDKPPSSPVEVDDGTISEDVAINEVESLLLPLRVVVVETSVDKVVARVS